MPLRDSLIARIWSAIERSPFTPADFDVDVSGGESLLSVVFRHAPAYSIVVNENWKGEVSALVSPGEYKKQETIFPAELQKIPEYVTAWARNVRDELRSTVPVYSELDALKEALEQHINEHIENPNEPFTEEEADDLRAKLDILMQRFQEMQERSELTEQELNRLNREIASIKENLPSYPKAVWYKTAANRILTSVNKVATSKESRQVLAQAAQKLLGLDP